MTLFVGVLIHLAFRLALRKRGYRGVSAFEATVILIGTIPGLGGCARGWAGFGFPMPLVVGLPLSLALLGDPDCGWWQGVLSLDLDFMREFWAFPAAWLLANALLISALYAFKARKARLFTEVE